MMDDHTGHDHAAHDHPDRDRPAERTARRPLAIALGITMLFLVAEVVGGLLTNSLALLADAGHMATDAAALALSLFAVWLALGYLQATTTTTGLRVEVALLDGHYPTGQTVSDAQMQALALDRHDVCPTWNYTLRPRSASLCSVVPDPANREVVS